MSAYSQVHLIAKELLDTPLIVKTEIDKEGDVTINLHVKDDPRQSVVLSLDYPNWATLRDRVDSHFMDEDLERVGKQRIGKEPKGMKAQCIHHIPYADCKHCIPMGKK